MPEAPNNAPPLLLLTRHGRGISDTRYLEHRQHLLESVTVPSLLAQTDSAFIWAISIEADMPASARARLERMVEPFGERVLLTSRHLPNASGVTALARRFGLDASGWVLSGRLDDDDAWHPDSVRLIRQHAGAWLQREERGEALAMTFGLGYEWLMYDLVDRAASERRGHPVILKAIIHPFHTRFMGCSVFVLSRAGSGLSCFSATHPQMEALFHGLGHDVQVLMEDSPMWLFTRHKQVATNYLHGPLHPLDLSLREITRLFGLDHDKVARYIDSESEFDYLQPDAIRQRNELAAQLGALRQALRDGTRASDADTDARLLALSEQLATVKGNVLGKAGETSDG